MQREDKFLNMLYDDMVKKGLYSEDAKPRDIKDKLVRVRDRLNRFRDFENDLLQREKIDLLKRLYYDKYVIDKKDIPDSYYKMQERIAKERGYGDLELMDFEKNEFALMLIMDQKSSLDKWLDYLFSDDAKFYPYYLKYWAFHGMLKLGSYDKEKKMFGRRTKGTVSSFAELNIEALALTMSYMEESLKVDFLDDDEIKVVLGNNSFEKIYTYYFNKVSLDKKNNSLENKGRWIKYDKGSDCVPLVKSLEGRATGWCTASMGTAEKQLSLGDFYVYYTLDEEGEYKIPRLAIRMEGENIAEVRGIANNQEIEDKMHDVITKKLKEFPDSELYLKKVSDMKMMTNIYRKDEKGEELTREELRFLYQIDSKIVGFGYGRDPRIVELTLKRNRRSDFAIMYNCREDQIAFSLEELLANNEEIVCCFVNMSDRDIPENKLYFPKLRYVGANIILREVKNIECFKVLEYVLNDFNCPNASSISGVDNLWYIGLDAKFCKLKRGDCLKKLKYIGLHAYFNSLENDDLLNLEYIGGVPCFDYLERVNGIKNEYINKKIDEYYRFNKKERRR